MRHAITRWGVLEVEKVTLVEEEHWGREKRKERLETALHLTLTLVHLLFQGRCLLHMGERGFRRKARHESCLRSFSGNSLCASCSPCT